MQPSASLRQRIENDAGIGQPRAVIEGNHHLAVSQRQRLLVLHGAKPGRCLAQAL
jgi:hypothetical protein